PGDELRLPDLDGGEHGGGEVGGRFRILQRGQAPDQGRVEGQGSAATGASLAMFAGSEPLGTAQRAVGQRLQLGVGEMAHDRCSAATPVSAGASLLPSLASASVGRRLRSRSMQWLRAMRSTQAAKGWRASKSPIPT